MLEQKVIRTKYFDWLNVAACFSVVVLHSTGAVFQFSESGTWWAAMLLQTLCHFSIPVFFMLSGATLMGYRNRYTTRVYFQNRWRKIGIPFLFWTAFYIIWNIAILRGSAPSSVLDIVNIFTNNGASNIFWFFYSLIPIYFLIPVLSLIDWHKNRRLLLYVLALCFLSNQILPIVSKFAGITISSYADFPLRYGYIDYVLLGVLLRDIKLTVRRIWLIFAGGIIGFIGMAIGTYLLSRAKGIFDVFFMDYHSIFCYLMAAAVFVFARLLSDRSSIQRYHHILKPFSEASFGIYLIHILVLTLVSRFIDFPHPIISMALSPIVTYVISFGAVFIINKIPIMKRIV